MVCASPQTRKRWNPAGQSSVSLVPIVTCVGHTCCSCIRERMQGPATVAVEQGTAYALCPRPRPLDVVCDPGAEAYDAWEGDLTPRLEACSTSQQRFLVSRFGVRGCALNTSAAPAELFVTFTVRDSTGLEGSATRRAFRSCVPTPSLRGYHVVMVCSPSTTPCRGPLISLPQSCDQALGRGLGQHRHEGQCWTAAMRIPAAESCGPARGPKHVVPYLGV